MGLNEGLLNDKLNGWITFQRFSISWWLLQGMLGTVTQCPHPASVQVLTVWCAPVLPQQGHVDGWQVISKLSVYVCVPHSYMDLYSLGMRTLCHNSQHSMKTPSVDREMSEGTSTFKLVIKWTFIQLDYKLMNVFTDIVPMYFIRDLDQATFISHSSCSDTHSYIFHLAFSFFVIYSLQPALFASKCAL